MTMGLVPRKTSQIGSLNFDVEKINNGYLCHHESDTWFFPNKEDLVKYITDLIEEI
jgi:hypothetical protein